MLLIFGNDRLDFREFPNLMTNRFGIGADQFFAATSAFGRHARYDRLTLLDRNQGAFVFVVPWLASAFAFRFGLGRRLVMRMRGGGGLGRVGGFLRKP